MALKTDTSKKTKKLAKKDYDKDGKVETPEQEYKGSKNKAIKKSKGKAIAESFIDRIKYLLLKSYIS